MTAGALKHNATAWWLGAGVLMLAVLARSLAVLLWPDVWFDADQAVMGLMAKHLAEGRGFPVFQYAWSYVLMIEAWLLALVIPIADNSATLVKAVPVALNVLAIVLLYRIVTATRLVSLPLTLVALAPFALTAPGASADLTDALGMSVEPLVAALLMWMWRDRPMLLGVTAAIGMKNREFVLYAATALIAIDLCRDRTAVFWRTRAVALVAFAVTWSAISVLWQFSTPFGPGTSFAMMAARGDNLTVVAATTCLDLRLMPGDLWVTATQLLPMLFGVAARPSPVPLPLNAPWLWVPLVALLAAAVGRGAWRAWREGPSLLTWFGAFLVLIGLQAIAAYALTRCGAASVHTVRYLLLALTLPTGALLLAFEREGRTRLAAILTVVVAAWTAMSAINHGAQLMAFARQPPERGYRVLAEYLDAHGVRHIVSDYWTGYYVAFLTSERIVAHTDFGRVHEYTGQVHAHRAAAYEIRRPPQEPCVGAVTVAGFYVCAPPPRDPPGD